MWGTAAATSWRQLAAAADASCCNFPKHPCSRPGSCCKSTGGHTPCHIMPSRTHLGVGGQALPWEEELRGAISVGAVHGCEQDAGG